MRSLGIGTTGGFEGRYRLTRNGAVSLARRLLIERIMAAKKTRKYGPKATSKVGKAMHERKEGTLRSGRSSNRVTSRKQAVAIGLAEARREGAKVPPKKKTGRKSAKRRKRS